MVGLIMPSDSQRYLFVWFVSSETKDVLPLVETAQYFVMRFSIIDRAGVNTLHSSYLSRASF